MKKAFLALSTVALLSQAAPALAEAPLGDWICSGSNPGDSRSYRGYVNVLRSGDTFTVLWRFGTNTYLGTGLDLGDAFAVSFIQPQNDSQVVGLALFRKQARTGSAAGPRSAARAWARRPGARARFRRSTAIRPTDCGAG